MNSVNLIGRLTRDPELRTIPGSGTSVGSFTLAVDKGLSKQKREEMVAKDQPTADFIGITVWGKQAESCAQYLGKGNLVGVTGRIQTGRHENKEGVMVYTTDVVAHSVEFLEFVGDKKKEENTSPDGNEGFMPDAEDIPF